MDCPSNSNWKTALMHRRLALLSSFAPALLLAAAVSAVEALSTEELASHCVFYQEDPDGEDGIFCVRYIQGFIDGAVATDKRVASNVADEYDRRRTLTDRALRTRLNRQTERFPSYYAEFCLGEPVPLKAVAELVIADLADPALVAGQPLARDVVYATLRREFPCVPSADE